MTFVVHQPITDPDQPLRARALRYLLLDELRRRPSMTVAELATRLADVGFTFTGRPSKVISDSLRWEVRRGRVERLARGVYRYRPTPWSTMRRVVLFARFCRAWVRAATSGHTPPPTPPNLRPAAYAQPQTPDRPPWAHLGWLWTT